MNIWERLFGGRRTSKDIAKERLQFVLVHDRAKIPPALVETLKDEIVAVISKHIDIDQAGMRVTVTQGRGHNRLVADIPIVGTRH